MIVLHPKWIHRAGVGDIVRHFDRLGFDVSNRVGSPFLIVKPKPAVVPIGTPIKQGTYRAFNFFGSNK